MTKSLVKEPIQPGFNSYGFSQNLIKPPPKALSYFKEKTRHLFTFWAVTANEESDFLVEEQ